MSKINRRENKKICIYYTDCLYFGKNRQKQNTSYGIIILLSLSRVCIDAQDKNSSFRADEIVLFSLPGCLTYFMSLTRRQRSGGAAHPGKNPVYERSSNKHNNNSNNDNNDNRLIGNNNDNDNVVFNYIQLSAIQN